MGNSVNDFILRHLVLSVNMMVCSYLYSSCCNLVCFCAAVSGCGRFLSGDFVGR